VHCIWIDLFCILGEIVQVPMSFPKISAKPAYIQAVWVSELWVCVEKWGAGLERCVIGENDHKSCLVVRMTLFFSHFFGFLDFARLCSTSTELDLTELRVLKQY
jgi:hypothetical protein